MCFINKMDRVGADFDRTVAMIRDRLEASPAVIQLPIGAEGGFEGVIDLLKMKALVWGEGMGETWETRDIPATLLAGAEEARHALIDVVSNYDDNVMERYVADEEITAEDLRRALRTATIASEVVPVLCGSAFKNKAVQPMLDAVVDFLPSPLDVPPTEGLHPKSGETISREHRDDEPFSALAFKIMSDPFVGKLTYLRVYSGTLEKGTTVMNSSRDRKERIGRILQMHANHREDREAVYTGDIVAVVGLKSTTTGDTLCDISHPILLESLEFPEPVIHVAVEPKTKADQDKLSRALFALSEEDPTFRVRSDQETGQTVISGMGELHLEVLVDRMLREFKVDANVGKPQVAYRETIRQSVHKIEERYIRQTGGRGQYGHVVIDLEPTGPGGGFEFVDKVTGGVIPKEYIPAVDAGIQEAMNSGVLAGFPIVDVRVTLVYGSYHDVDSSEMAFKIAGSMAFKKAVRAAHPAAAGADHGGRGRHAGGQPGRRHRRPLLSTGPDRGHGTEGREPRRESPGPTVRYVRLRYRPAFPHAGSRDVHDAVRLLPGGSGVGFPGDHRPGDRRVSGKGVTTEAS